MNQEIYENQEPNTVAFFKSEIMIGGLSGYKLRRVKAFIDENLGEDLTLGEIAGVVGGIE